MAAKAFSVRQPYPRESSDLLAAHFLFPPHRPILSDQVIGRAIERAFERVLCDRVGRSRHVVSTPQELVHLCIKHLNKRSCPVLSPYFYSLCNVEEIFELDAIPHEMQRQRMSIGVFYQFLVIELMKAGQSKRKSSNIEAVFDGSREGDVVADIKTPSFSTGLRVYASIKKSSDTVGGQDVPGAITRLEKIAKAEKNITRPYLCVFCYATPPGGKIKGYGESRSVKRNLEGHPFSENCESWEPGFLFPFISGRSAMDIYKISSMKVDKYLPFYTMKYRKKCSELLMQEFKKMKLIGDNGVIDRIKFEEFIIRNQS